MRLFIFATAIFLCSQTLAQTYEFEGFSVDLPAGVQVRKKMVDTIKPDDELYEFFNLGRKILFIYTSYHPVFTPLAPSLDYENLVNNNQTTHGVRWQCGDDTYCFAVKFSFLRKDTRPYMLAGYEGNDLEDAKLANQIINSLKSPELPVVENYITQRYSEYNIFKDYCISVPKNYLITRTKTLKKSQYTFSKIDESGHVSPPELIISDDSSIDFIPTKSSYDWEKDFALLYLYKNFGKNNISIHIQKHSNDLIYFYIEVGNPKIFLKFISHYSKNRQASVFLMIDTLRKRDETTCDEFDLRKIEGQ